MSKMKSKMKPKPESKTDASESTNEGAGAPVSGESRLTLANALTILRLFAAPLCGFLVLSGQDSYAVVVFVFAIATDLVDGPIARKRGGSSAFGALLDHGTDATFVVLGIAALAARGLAPVLLPPLITFAFLQYTLDSRALAGEQLRASSLGRWNGILYFALLGTPIIRNTLGWTLPSDGAIVVLGWLLLASTVVSIGDRLLALRKSRQR
ncbi:MAG: CDP-diacylglycerol--glycerol-3-phosphate 3-phosphatidyltransferase [Myxococcota bacterium]|jgi:CDP-diacylglycerol--glycerol-3-phosphate 3-phosphatidyltransferase